MTQGAPREQDAKSGSRGDRTPPPGACDIAATSGPATGGGGPTIERIDGSAALVKQAAANTPPPATVISVTDQDDLHPASTSQQEAAPSLASSLSPSSRQTPTTVHNHSQVPSQNQHPSPQQQQQQQQWLAQVAAQTHQEVRQRMSQAGDQLNLSIRQIYASASSIAAEMPPSYHNIPGIVPYNQGRSIGPPPSYDDVINPYAPPPTYHSLFGQIGEARKRSRSLMELLSRLFIILVSTLGCTILIAFMILIPFTMIIVGAAYIDECRIEHIPAFLLVGGLVWASKSILHCYSQCRQMPSMDSVGGAGAGSGRSELGLDEIYLSASSVSLATSFDTDSSSTSGGGGAEIGQVGVDSNAGGSSSATDVLEPHEASVAAAAAAVTAPVAPSSVGLEHDLQSSGLARNDQRADRIHGRHRHRAARRHHHHHHHHHHQRRIRSREQALYEASRDRSSADSSAARASRLKSSICESLLNCVLFGWFIAGCVIVFRNYEPDFDNPLSPCYCHKTVYMYTLWLITSAILLLGLFVGCICCLIVSSAMASHQDDADDELA